jgi:cyclopropane fatty-acyl-phospholipid synthase-like methyltransferase
MFELALYVTFVLTLVFAIGALMGAPYLPTLKSESEVALNLLNLKRGQTVLDLGSGDGSFLRLAAQRGLRGIGWEINPLLVVFSKVRLWKYRKQVSIRWRNIWATPIPKVDAIYIFGIKRYMGKFERKLKNELTKPTKIVCFTFKLPKAKPIRVENGITLYKLP